MHLPTQLPSIRDLQKVALVLLLGPASFLASTYLLKIVLGLPLLLLFPIPEVALAVSLLSIAFGLAAAVILCRGAWPR